MLPCKVIAATDDRNYVTAQILLKIVGTGGDTQERSQIAKVPMMNMGAGNFLLSFPVQPGDLGWIIASDRDISLYLQSNKAEAPNTGRFHSFEDGMFIPDKARQWVLAAEDKTNKRVVLQSLDGASKVAMGDDMVRIVHPTLVEIFSPHVTLTNGDLKVLKGIGFWNHAVPGSQPVIMGALSAVSDPNAKAVLSFIIAVMVGCGQATDGTT